MSISLSLRQHFRRVVTTEPKDAIPAVLFSMMVVTMVFIGKPPYALAKQSKPDNTAQAMIHCSDGKHCDYIKNRS